MSFLMCLLTDNMYALTMSGASRKVFVMIPRIYVLGLFGVSFEIGF